MKHALWMPFLLLIGLVAGGLATRQELRETRDQLAQARKELEKHPASRGAEIQGVTQLLGIGAGQSEAARETSPAPRRKRTFSHARRLDEKGAGNETPPGEDPNTRLSASKTETRPTEDSSEQETETQDRESIEARIEQAAELWSLRSDIARSTFISNLNLDKDQTAQFDVLMEAMNIRMQDKISTWTESAKKKEEIGPEDGVRLANEVTGVLVLTYDEMDRKMPVDWRKKGGRDLQLVDFVDPKVAMPLIEIEDKLSDVRARPR